MRNLHKSGIILEQSSIYIEEVTAGVHRIYKHRADESMVKKLISTETLIYMFNNIDRVTYETNGVVVSNF